MGACSRTRVATGIASTSAATLALALVGCVSWTHGWIVDRGVWTNDAGTVRVDASRGWGETVHVWMSMEHSDETQEWRPMDLTGSCRAVDRDDGGLWLQPLISTAALGGELEYVDATTLLFTPHSVWRGNDGEPQPSPVELHLGAADAHPNPR